MADTQAEASPSAPDEPIAGETGRKRPPRRHLLLRLFGIGPWGALKLIALCVFVGFIVMATNFDPADPDVKVTRTLAALMGDAWHAAVWAARNFWKPALAGAGVVMPVWVLWRLVSLPFRK